MCPEGIYIIALAIDPDYPDYHWYRPNPDGSWSHKRGITEVNDIDASGNQISDPQNANRNYGFYNYEVFIGYYCVTPLNKLYQSDTDLRNADIMDDAIFTFIEDKKVLPTYDMAEKVVPGMTYAEVTNILGEPQRQLSSGLIVVEYDLPNNNSLIVEYRCRNGQPVVESCSIHGGDLYEKNQSETLADSGTDCTDSDCDSRNPVPSE